MANNVFMARKKSNQQNGTGNDRHKPHRMVRLRERLAAILDKLAEQNATSVTEEMNRAVREMLQREGLWPQSKQ